MVDTSKTLLEMADGGHPKETYTGVLSLLVSCPIHLETQCSDILVNEIKTETKINTFLLTKTETKTKNNCETKTK
jgi:hypothetical protein